MFVSTTKGQDVPMPDSKFEYQYFLKDHLGNTRVVLSQTGQVLQQNSYYPFGMLMACLPATEAYNTNKYLYNGKELQEDFALDWYDYGARFYDAQLGRWHMQDALSEWHFNITNYNYCFNNPVNNIDPMGLDTILPTIVDPKDPKKKKRLLHADLPEVEITAKKDNAKAAHSWGYFFVTNQDNGVDNDSRKGDGEKRNIDKLLDVFGPSNIRSKLIYLMVKLFFNTNSNDNNNTHIKTSDKEIIDRHTGIGEKTDARGIKISTIIKSGKYKGWIKVNSNEYKAPKGDTILKINTNGDSILYIGFDGWQGHRRYPDTIYKTK